MDILIKYNEYHSKRKRVYKKKVSNDYNKYDDYDYGYDNDNYGLSIHPPYDKDESDDNEIYSDEFVKNDLKDNFSKDFSKIFLKSLPFKNIIRVFNDYLSKFLLKGMLFVDIGPDSNNNISYLSIRDKGVVIDKGLDVWNNNYRKITKIGRLLKKINVNDIDIINKYNTEYKRLKKLFYFELVDGEDIRHWYLEDNYKKGGGSLNKSCMRYKKTQHKFDIYVNNPEVCKLLILKESKESNLILGRSLIWKTNNGYYMDRIYTYRDDDKNFFIDYAKDKGWIRYNEGKLRVKIKNDNIFIKKPKYYPFMDTFKYYHYYKNILSNYKPRFKFGYIVLNDL